MLTQPSPQALSARSILDSTVSCNITEIVPDQIYIFVTFLTKPVVCLELLLANKRYFRRNRSYNVLKALLKYFIWYCIFELKE